jgi:protein-S-isoprenylcysteine O-methyltransferase Ste14
MTPDVAVVWLWVWFVITWFAIAFWRRPTARAAGPGVEAMHLIVTLAGFVLLFARPDLAPVGTSAATEPLWPADDTLKWAFVGVEALGCAFAWWARLSLGTYWSASVTLKADHKVVDTGAYALVRHPIYTGMLLAALGVALERATPIAFAGLALILLGFTIKAHLEERFIRKELGPDAYDAYARRVGMLIPGIGKGR